MKDSGHKEGLATCAGCVPPAPQALPFPAWGQGGSGTHLPRQGGSPKTHTREGASFKAMAQKRQLDLMLAAKEPFCYFIFTLILCGLQHTGKNSSKKTQH